MARMHLDTPNHCDICGKARATRKHQACSRIRQQRKAAEWDAVMAEKTAVRLTKGKRYAR